MTDSPTPTPTQNNGEPLQFPRGIKGGMMSHASITNIYAIKETSSPMTVRMNDKLLVQNMKKCNKCFNFSVNQEYAFILKNRENA